MSRGSARALPTGRGFLGRFSAGWLGRRVLMAGLIAPFVVDGILLLAGRGGLFGVGSGVALRELAICSTLLGFLLINARTLRRIDCERLKAMHSLRAAHESLQAWAIDQARVEEELRDSERRYRFLADSVPQIVWTARSDGGVDYFNGRWTEFTGQSLEEAMEWGWMPVIHPDDLDRCTRRWRQAFESGERYDIEYRFRRADGVYRWQLGRADAMRDESGRVVRWFGTCTDIDDQKRVEVELLQIQEGLAGRMAERTGELETANLALMAEVAERKLAEEAAQAASRAKGEFLANMSHEIRTPMNGILGMIELTLGTELSAAQREYLQIVSSSADALLTVINDILDFSKIEAGKLELDPVPFSPRDAVAETLRSLALRAHEKGIELACRIDPDVPRSVVGDQGRLRQILINLVGNAIKFTERGEVVVSVASGAVDAPGRSARLHFAVSDTGIGIPAAKREAIFAAFEQADNSTTRKHGGTGLGLTISAKLVALMGGTIAVTANPGGGSLFRFDARFATDDGAPVAFEPGYPDALAGLPVLVVDDNATSRRITEEVLGRWGCRPVAVTGGDEALARLVEGDAQGRPYAAVILNRSMPGLDGLSFAARLRSWEAASPGRPSRLRLLMLTAGESDRPDRPEFDHLDGWLPKPVRPSELLNLLLDALLAPPAGADGAAGTAPASRRATLDPARPPGRPLEVLLAEDHPVNQRVATRMIEDLGHRVTVVGDGRAAVDESASGRFDLILMDVQMPELDGFEALAAIRGREFLAAEAADAAGRPLVPHLPIIALTAHAMTGDRERCLNAGFDDYLSKPVCADRLRDALAPYVVASATRPAPPRPPAPPPASAEPSPFDRSGALDAMGGDEALLDEIIRLFLDDTPQLLGRIHAAVDAANHADLARLGHTLAGGASNLGLKPVIAAARRVERAGKLAADPAEARAAVAALNQAFDAAQAVLLAEVASCP